ncbi:MAG TPA: hypothetical protein VHR88_07735 [Solirubrobacteraceae bacterium]|nr:hypothetical protein [Solirubrobacteraceae bacterium]
MPGAHHHIEIEHALPAVEPGFSFHKWVTLLVGLAAAFAGILAFGEAESNRQKEHEFVEAARDAELIFVRLGASTGPDQFRGNAIRSALSIAQQGTALVIGTKNPGQPFAYALALAKADRRAGARLQQVATQMSTVPATTPGLDERTSAAVRSSLGSALPLLAKQQHAVEEADRWASRQEHTIFALGLVAIAAALGGLAGLMGVGRPGRLAAATGSIALAVAVVWSAVTFLT